MVKKFGEVAAMMAGRFDEGKCIVAKGVSLPSGLPRQMSRLPKLKVGGIFDL